MHSWLARLKRVLRWDEDAFSAYRDRVAIHLTALAALLLVPFTVVHLLAGRVALATVIAVAQAVLLVNAAALQAGRAPWVPTWIMCALLIVAVCASVWLQGINGAFWAFPTLFICFFQLPRKVALGLSLALLLGVTAAATASIGYSIALRVFATLMLTLVMIHVVLNVIGELQRALVEQAITDPLTGAFNRRHLQAQLERMAAPDAARQSADVAHALLAIDIDQFKRINDRYGHAVGDRVLREVVAALRERTRSDDMLFRIGGEEFVLLLPATGIASAQALAEDLRRQVEAAPILADEPVTVSVGVCLQRSGASPESWLREADRALYRAKNGGRNRVELAA
jgi:diguanylate cyclase (GGDEF)-like protein